MNTKWKTVPLESLDTDGKPPVARIALSQKFERLLQSPSGLSAIVLRQAAVSSCADLALAWKDESVEYNAMSIVVPGSDALDEEHCGDIYALRTICDLIALPSDFADRDWNDLQICGSMGVAGAAASYTLLQNRPVDASSLLQGVPKQVDRPDDNLDDREKWFKIRHETKE